MGPRDILKSITNWIAWTVYRITHHITLDRESTRTLLSTALLADVPPVTAYEMLEADRRDFGDILDEDTNRD